MSSKSRAFVLLVCLAFASSTGIAGASRPELKRRGMMGVQLGPVTEEAKERLKLADTSGVLINGVVPGGAAEAAGMKPNDVVIRIADQSVGDVNALTGMMRAYGAGDSVSLTVWRDGQETKMELVLRPRPGESWSDCELLYETAGEPGKLVRLLVTKPKTEGKRPAVLMVLGITRQPSEIFFPGLTPFKSLISELSKAGYVTARVDRPGAGDSEGSYDALTPESEAEAIRAAVRRLGELDFVDSSNVFVLGHSSGTTALPAAVNGERVRGVITYAAVAKPWTESIGETLARQGKLELLSDDEIRERFKAWKDFVELFVSKEQTPADIVKENPEIRSSVGDILQGGLIRGMPAGYARRTAKLAPVESWSHVSVPVLVIWGEADYVADRKDSEAIAAMVNRNAAGRAKFVSLAETDHDLGRAADAEEAFLTGNNPFQPKFLEVILIWMQEQSKGA